jgi:hypothetical protein
LLLGIPNFWNVVTNLPFLLVGIYGLWLLRKREIASGMPALRPAFYLFSLGVLLVAFGSSYYHWHLTTATLVWDRLPMTIVFMSLLAIIIGETISLTLGRRLLWPLLAAGIASVVYWAASEARGHGDLRPYAVVQLLPILLIPVLLFRSRFAKSKYGYLLAALVAYLLAKLAEHYDVAIYHLLGVFSGHPLKHLLAAASTLFILLAWKGVKDDS